MQKDFNFMRVGGLAIILSSLLLLSMPSSLTFADRPDSISRSSDVSLDSFTLVENDYLSENIDYDEKIKNYVFALFEKESLDDRYQSDAIAEDLTMIIAELRSAWNKVDDNTKHILEEYGYGYHEITAESQTPAIFDHSASSAGCAFISSPSTLTKSKMTPHFNLHYETSGSDAVPTFDGLYSLFNGVPDYVDEAADFLEASWVVNLENRWKSPITDGKVGGGSSKIDVYFYDIAPFGAAGVAIPDILHTSTSNPNDYKGYTCIDNDLSFDLFSLGAQDSQLAATSAHEFAHLVQFAYNGAYHGDEASWMFESSARWFQDQVFDSNDLYAFSAEDFLSTSDLQLTSTLDNRQYGAGIWHLFVTDQYGDDVLRRTWELAALNPAGIGPQFDNNAKAIEEVTYGGSWKNVFYNFAINNAFVGGFDLARGSAFTAEEADVWPGHWPGQLIDFDGTTTEISDDNHILQGGGSDYLYILPDGNSRMKISFDGDNSGDWMISVALIDIDSSDFAVQVKDIPVKGPSKTGSITIFDADTYDEIDVIIRNMDHPSSTINRAWEVTINP